MDIDNINIVKKIRLVLIILTVPFMNLFYSFLNNSERGAKSLVTDIDRGLPFVKGFIIPYIIWYVFIYAVLLYLMFKDEKTFVCTVITIDICIMLCYIIYFNFQTTVPRPFVTGNDMLSSMVNIIYTIDRPFNCFPSIHCLTSYIMIKAISKSKVKNVFNFSIIALISILIIFSTMFIKQHVILDVVSAIIIGNIVFEFIYNFNREIVLSWIKTQYSSLTMKRKSEI